MTTDDPRLREFFEEERRRDSLGAPPFRAPFRAPAPAPAAESEARRARSFPIRRTAAAIAAAALGFVLVRSLAPGGAELSTSTGPEWVDVADLDALCDAALAALDELESEAQMESSTDALLRPFDSETD